MGTQGPNLGFQQPNLETQLTNLGIQGPNQVIQGPNLGTKEQNLGTQGQNLGTKALWVIFFTAGGIEKFLLQITTIFCKILFRGETSLYLGQNTNKFMSLGHCY